MGRIGLRSPGGGDGLPSPIKDSQARQGLTLTTVLQHSGALDLVCNTAMFARAKRRAAWGLGRASAALRRSSQRKPARRKGPSRFGNAETTARTPPTPTGPTRYPARALSVLELWGQGCRRMRVGGQAAPVGSRRDVTLTNTKAARRSGIYQSGHWFSQSDLEGEGHREDGLPFHQ